MRMLTGTRRGLLGARRREAWTPTSPTSSGGVLPHTWHYAGSGAIYQDAAKTTVARADDDIVYVSTNQGSDTHDIVQATAANRPTLKLNVLNGQPVFRHDGADSLHGAFTAGLTQPNTIFAVTKLDATVVNDGGFHYLFDGAVATRVFLCQHSTPDPDEWAVNAGNAMYGDPTDSDWHVWCILLNGLSSALWSGGVSMVTGNAGISAMDGLTLGARIDGALPWKGDVAAWLAYPGNLSDADKNQVGNYLGDKYGRSWTNL